MGTQFLYNVFHISQLLREKEGKIQQPVIVPAIPVPGIEIIPQRPESILGQMG